MVKLWHRKWGSDTPNETEDLGECEASVEALTSLVKDLCEKRGVVKRPDENTKNPLRESEPKEVGSYKDGRFVPAFFSGEGKGAKDLPYEPSWDKAFQALEKKHPDDIEYMGDSVLYEDEEEGASAVKGAKLCAIGIDFNLTPGRSAHKGKGDGAYQTEVEVFKDGSVEFYGWRHKDEKEVFVILDAGAFESPEKLRMGMKGVYAEIAEAYGVLPEEVEKDFKDKRDDPRTLFMNRIR